MPETLPNFNHNQPVYTVTEISNGVRRTLEDKFGTIRLRGEISGFKRHSSGTIYFSIKDEKNCIAAVIWQDSVAKIPFKPEDGLEVVCTGKLTAYGAQSKYQIRVDRMEPAGIGALMAQLERRREQFRQEGLFHAEHKRPLPFLPRIIGVITSPTGAVIRDILHRISDRFPLHVIVWPVLVQGDGAAEQVAAAIAGFNAHNAASPHPKPDLLIVARGGGSIEDLWAFNEEIVVRAVFASRIPLISAVGHETDTTLIDYVSDQRAPTPTAAAEMAVPVRQELQLRLKQLDARMAAGMQRALGVRRDQLEGLSRGLPRTAQLLEAATQKLDDWSERLLLALPAAFAKREQQLAALNPANPAPWLSAAGQRLAQESERLLAALPATLARREQQLAALAGGLRPQALLADTRNMAQRLDDLHTRLKSACLRAIARQEEQLRMMNVLLESVNYQRVLERGFALVRDAQGHVVTSAMQAREREALTLTFGDGEVMVKPG